MENREFQSVPIIVIPPGMRVMLDPPRVNVLLHGPRSKLARIKPEDITATINFHDLPEGKKRVTPKLSLPEGISLVKVIPEEVEINIVTEKEGNKLLQSKPKTQTSP
jgi:YbbR domain-containing protein